MLPAASELPPRQHYQLHAIRRHYYGLHYWTYLHYAREFRPGNIDGHTRKHQWGTIIVQLAGTGASGPKDYGLMAVTDPWSYGWNPAIRNAASGAAKAFNIRGNVPNLVIDSTSLVTALPSITR